MNTETAAALLAPFPPEQIGKLPRVTCGDCSKRDVNCAKHHREKCSTCGAYVSTAHIHLDYVGHADVTRRLTEVDPEWTWAPYAEADGLPVFDTDSHGAPVGLWIRLTVGGKTLPGYGSCPSGQTDAVKVLIGDALRNAAMRFGVAVDLWAKGDRADPAAENATAAPATASRRRASRPEAAQEPEQLTASAVRAQIVKLGKARGLSVEDLAAAFAERSKGVTIGSASVEELVAYRDALQASPEPEPEAAA